MATKIHDQTNILPKTRLLIVFGTMASGLFTCFLDQSSIVIGLPTIGRDLDCATTITWAGTSAMIANTAFQVLHGRLSDIFGRKIVIILALLLLAVADLCCGFAQTGTQLYAFRGLAGVAFGGVQATVMMIVSDIVTLEERGKYQGILGSCIGLGNTAGPFIASAFIDNTSWRDMFFLIAPLAALAAGVMIILLPPSNMPKEDLKTKLSKIDYFGVISSTAAIILLLIPISGLGSFFDVHSAMVISMLTLGATCFLVFVVVEWKVAKIPMIPLRLFGSVPLTAMIIQNFFIGIVYYGILYYMPIYYQSARQWSTLVSAALLVPLVATQSVVSAMSGWYISWKGRYGEVMWLGFILWTITTSLHCIFSRTTPEVSIAFVLVFEGIAVGCIFQPTLIAAQAHSKKEDRAVVISTRNFIRALGGAVGLAISSTIFSNVLQSNLPDTLPENLTQEIQSSIFSAPDVSQLSSADRNAVLDAYMAASHSVFILWAAAMGLCLVLMIFVKDKGLQRAEEKAAVASVPEPNAETAETPVFGAEQRDQDTEKQIPAKSTV